MQRGEFLKLSCTGCILGATGIVSVLELLSCASPAAISVYKTQVSEQSITVPESAVIPGKIVIIRAKGMDYDIALSKDTHSEAANYYALVLRCTHFSNPLQVSGKDFTCSLHGSRFDEHGKVLNGPASKPLAQLPCSVSNGNILIHV